MPAKNGRATVQEWAAKAGSPGGKFDVLMAAQYEYLCKNAKCTDALLCVLHKIQADDRLPYVSLGIGEIAAKVGWAEQTTRNVINELRLTGRVKVEKKPYRIEVLGRIEPVEDGGTQSLTVNTVKLPAILLKTLEANFPDPQERAEKVAAYAAGKQEIKQWGRDEIAEARKRVRAEEASKEASLLERLGISKPLEPERSESRPVTEGVLTPNTVTAAAAQLTVNGVNFQLQKGSVSLLLREKTEEEAGRQAFSGSRESTPQTAPEVPACPTIQPEQSPEKTFEQELTDGLGGLGYPEFNVKLVHFPAKLQKKGVPLNQFFAAVSAVQKKKAKTGEGVGIGLLPHIAEETMLRWERDAYKRAAKAARDAVEQAELAADVAKLPPESPEVGSERCPKCGGMNVTYADGFVSLCKCRGVAVAKAKPPAIAYDDAGVADLARETALKVKRL